MGKINKYLFRLLHLTNKPELRILPGNIAYFLILSLIPLITLIALICTWFSIPLNGVLEELTNALPNEILEILIPAFTSPNFGIGISIIMGFIVASNGTNSIIIAANTLFRINEDQQLKIRIKSIFMLIILLTLFAFILLVLAFGNVILKFILSFDALNNIAETVYMIFILLKWPTAIILIFIMVKMIYTMAPSKNIPSRMMNRGAMFTTIGWLIVTAGYSHYVSRFANYSLFYGSLSNIIVLMIWIYILSYILVIGIAINSDKYHMENNATHNSK